MAYTTTFQAGNIDNWSGAHFTEVYADWDTPCVSGSPMPGWSVVWTGLGDYGGPLKQGGTEQDIDGNGFTTYYAWTENADSQPENYAYGVNCGDTIYSQMNTPNCAYVQDYNNGKSVYDCSGPNANTGDADFIVERPSNRIGPLPLADFQGVDLYNTYTNYGRGDTLVHAGVWMWNDGYYCASPGAWNYGSFTVTWQGSCG